MDVAIGDMGEGESEGVGKSGQQRDWAARRSSQPYHVLPPPLFTPSPGKHYIETQPDHSHLTHL